MKWLPTIMMAAGFLVAYASYIAAPWVPAWTVKNFKPIHAFLYNKWYFDELYHWTLVRPTRWLARILWIYGDGAIIDGLGPDGVSARVIAITKRTVRLQTGYVYHYAFVMLIGVAASSAISPISSAGLCSRYEGLAHFNHDHAAAGRRRLPARHPAGQ